MTEAAGPVLRALRLENFRNYPSVSLRLDGRPVVLFGANGAGKTNLLEAVSMLAPGRGMRRASVEDVTRRDLNAPRGPVLLDDEPPPPPPPWAVSADLESEDGETRIGVGQDPELRGRRVVRIDGENATQTDLGQLMRVAWLTPAHDRVFGGPRSERLRFFDRLTLAVFPDHSSISSRYDKAVRQRTRLLDDGRFQPAWLDGLETEMASAGVAVARRRVDLSVALQRAIDTRPDGPFPKADLALDGWVETKLAAGKNDDDVAKAFTKHLKSNRRRDARAKRSLDGPHRADLLVRHREKRMPAGDCSTGEQKALLVGVVLAHARALMAANPNARPILLLDEAAAHLDDVRRAALVDELLDLGAQAWMTGTDVDLFSAFAGRAQLFRVADGAVFDAVSGSPA